MWSLGAIAYVMLSGEYPFDGRSKAHIFRRIITGQCVNCQLCMLSSFKHQRRVLYDVA